MDTSKRFGLALGGGGVKGLAHVPFLEAVDELGLNITHISGTSIGAIIGALYASSMPGRQIRDVVLDFFNLTEDEPTGFFSKLSKSYGLLEHISLKPRRDQLLSAEKFSIYLRTLLGGTSFEDLDIPFKVVAADYWNRDQKVFESGDLLPAIEASFALPGLFKPVKIGENLYIDGGCVNPVPFDIIRQDCDVIIAIDVLGKKEPSDSETPSLTEALFNSFQIAEKALVREKYARFPPDIYIEPRMDNIRVMDISKTEEIFLESEAMCDDFKRQIQALLE